MGNSGVVSCHGGHLVILNKGKKVPVVVKMFHATGAAREGIKFEKSLSRFCRLALGSEEQWDDPFLPSHILQDKIVSDAIIHARAPPGDNTSNPE